MEDELDKMISICGDEHRQFIGISKTAGGKNPQILTDNNLLERFEKIMALVAELKAEYIRINKRIAKLELKLAEQQVLIDKINQAYKDK